uniref:Xylose isomerase n=1 Tax=Plectus sambesii TaxID=2011161 RepID=A0A914WRE7_9BILA
MAFAPQKSGGLVTFYDAPPNKYFDDAKVGGEIPYKPDAGVEDTLCFKHYNAKEVIHGRTMEEWLRFSVVYWHTFRGTGADPFGFPTLIRPWDDGTDSVENAKRRLRVAFEFLKRLGVKYYSFHDRDIAPEGSTLEETNKILDELTDLALQLQQETGIKLLWNTCNLFAHARYSNGAATNPDFHVLAYAGAQVKKGLDIAKKLGAENFVFWGGREGFHTLLNTNVKMELENLAAFFRQALTYKQKIGFTGQFLIEPKPKEPTKHQYDYDAMTVIAFLKTFGLENHFKLNIEPNHTTLAGHDFIHDIAMASSFSMLGSVDSNTGSPDLGWDTDQFPMDVKNCTLLMKVVLEQGGLAPGGLNFDCKVRRESNDIADLFIAHIGAMDTLARGLKSAAKIIEDGVLSKLITERYESFSSPEGRAFRDGLFSLEQCEQFVKAKGEPTPRSGRQEHFEAILNHYI